MTVAERLQTVSILNAAQIYASMRLQYWFLPLIHCCAVICVCSGVCIGSNRLGFVYVHGGFVVLKRNK